MKTKKRLIIFVILITIFSILSSIFDIKTYQNGNTIALKNIEALAYEETIKGITPAKIQAFAKKLLGQGNQIEVVMEP